MGPHPGAGAYTASAVINTPVDSTDGQAQAARRHALVLQLGSAAVVGVVLGLLGLLVAGGLGAIVGFVLGAVVVVAVAATGARRLRRRLDARPLPAAEAPRFHNLLDGLVVTVGVSPPEVLAIDDDGVNIGLLHGRSRSTLIVTRGLVERLDRLALEGVIARELHRLRADAHLVEGTAAGLFGWLSPALADRLAGVRHDLDREVLVDAEAMRHTRYPPGLAAGLAKADAHPGPGRGRLGVSWMIDPTPTARADVALRTAALDER